MTNDQLPELPHDEIAKLGLGEEKHIDVEYMLQDYARAAIAASSAPAPKSADLQLPELPAHPQANAGGAWDEHEAAAIKQFGIVAVLADRLRDHPVQRQNIVSAEPVPAINDPECLWDHGIEGWVRKPVRLEGAFGRGRDLEDL